MVHDDNVFQNRQWVEKFIELYKENNIDANFIMAGRSDNLIKNEDLLPELKKIGLVLVLIGFESGSDKILKYLRKGTTVEMNEKAASILHDLGIAFQANIMVGVVGETKEDLKLTLEFVKRIKPEICSPSIFAPYPSTYLYDEYKEKGLLYNNAEFRDGATSVPKIKGINYSYLNYMRFKISMSVLNTTTPKIKRVIYHSYAFLEIALFYMKNAINTN